MYPARLACAAAALLALSAQGATDPGLLLVANKGDRTLSIVDAAQGVQVAAVAEDGITGHEVAASPDGRLAYVPIYGNSGVGQKGTDGRIMRVIDLSSRAIVGTVDFGAAVRPHKPVFGPRDGMLYVTTELERSITVIDPATLRIVGSIPTGAEQSHMLAITADGTRGYTANVRPGSVSVLDMVHRTLVTKIPVSAVIQRISVSVDGKWAFTADQTAARMAVIDTARNAVTRSIPLPGVGFGSTVIPDGSGLLVTLPALRMVALVDLAKMRVIRTIDVPKAPQEILVTPDSSVAYVSCDSAARVAQIDLASWRVTKLIDVGRIDDGLAWAPRG
ncbi:MAG TPA: hypothetical protein VGG34_10115 [Opitutaceae bacterium]|jgi:DNA-binding beta-propeller fold protein YncE